MEKLTPNLESTQKKKLSDKVTNKSKKCHLEKRSTVSQRWSTITQLVNGQSVEREGVKK
jgi:hypothetical protein